MKTEITDEELLSNFDSSVAKKFNQIHNTFKGKKDAFEKGAGYGVVYASGLKSPSLPSEIEGLKEENDKKCIEFAEWIRVRYQNSPLEFDNYWEDMDGFPDNTEKSYTTQELLTLFNNRSK